MPMSRIAVVLSSLRLRQQPVQVDLIKAVRAIAAGIDRLLSDD